jgi:hypothetical protein
MAIATLRLGPADHGRAVTLHVISGQVDSAKSNSGRKRSAARS